LDYRYLKHLAKRGASYIHPKGNEATELLIEKLDIQEGNRILEPGCGTGATLCEIAVRFNVKIEDLDILEEMIDAANNRIKYFALQSMCNVRLTSAEKPFPFEEDAFDKVYAESVLGFQETEKIQLLLNETCRVLKQGGLFVFNELLWSEDADSAVIKEIWENSNKAFGLGPASHSGITRKTLCKMAEDSGFELVNVIELTDFKLSKPVKPDGFLKLQNKFNRKMLFKNLTSINYLFSEIKFRKNFSAQSKNRSYLNSFLFIFIKPKPSN